MSHVPEPWILVGDSGHITSTANNDVRQHWCMKTLDTGRHYGGDVALANARRIVACVNAFAGIPIEKFEGKSVAEFVTSQTMLTGMGPHERGGFGIQLEGGACHLLAEAFADQFKSSGAINYLEVNFFHDELGDISVTMQRTSGKTPGQLKSEAIAQRDELLQAMKKIVSMWDDIYPDMQCYCKLFIYLAYLIFISFPQLMQYR